ncbi:hypothetical protein J4456_04970 [Candidatus Pacearchaeota archaeon]|nr:hypothetical protein [Candidatus Pacearchaeota archaeon]
MAIDISGIFVFMPIFSFLFVFLITYAALSGTKVLGENNLINVFIGMIMAVIFLSFASLDFYVRTIVPWFVVLFVCTFLILLLFGFSTNKLEWIRTKAFGFALLGILLLIFLIAAIRVFNPIFHPDLVLTTGENTSLMRQIFNPSNDRAIGSILLIIAAAAVAYVITKNK